MSSDCADVGVMTMTADAIRDVLSEGKGEQITVLPTVRQSGGLFTHIVVVTAGSARHAAALTDRVVKAHKSGKGAPKPGVEESETREWVLIDCGDIIVHIMQTEARERYRLEELWGFENSG